MDEPFPGGYMFSRWLFFFALLCLSNAIRLDVANGVARCVTYIRQAQNIARVFRKKHVHTKEIPSNSFFGQKAYEQIRTC